MSVIQLLQVKSNATKGAFVWLEPGVPVRVASQCIFTLRWDIRNQHREVIGEVEDQYGSSKARGFRFIARGYLFTVRAVALSPHGRAARFFVEVLDIHKKPVSASQLVERGPLS